MAKECSFTLPFVDFRSGGSTSIRSLDLNAPLQERRIERDMRGDTSRRDAAYRDVSEDKM